MILQNFQYLINFQTQFILHEMIQTQIHPPYHPKNRSFMKNFRFTNFPISDFKQLIFPFLCLHIQIMLSN